MTGDPAARTPHGLIIGKLYPPHSGHERLVRAAAAASDRVTVLVLGKAAQSRPPHQRAAWLAEAVADLDNVTVLGDIDPHRTDYADPAVWDLHIAEIHRMLATVTDQPVTAIFSSEPYGDELAARLEARHVAVDPQRVAVPISATAVRADPVATWEWLPLSVRGALALRVVVVGAESTGKTTLAEALVDRLQARGGSHRLTTWVPEYGRERTIELLALARAADPSATIDDVAWPTAEFVRIARVQDEQEDEAARGGGPVLMCDTDAFATGIWHERYRGKPSAEVDALARRHPLYLVTHPDGVPFEADDIRDGEHLRPWMTDRFVAALTETGRRHVVLHGSLEDRLDAAEAAIDHLIAEGWGFTDPADWT